MGTRSNRLGEVVLTSTHNLCFEHKYEKYQSFYPEIFYFFLGGGGWGWEFSTYLNRRVFVMCSNTGKDTSTYHTLPEASKLQGIEIRTSLGLLHTSWLLGWRPAFLLDEVMTEGLPQFWIKKAFVTATCKHQNWYENFIQLFTENVETNFAVDYK